MDEKKLKITLGLLLGVFILIIFEMFLMGADLTGLARTIMIYSAFTLWFLFFLLGIILVIFTLKSDVRKKLKVFLLLTGFSSIGFLIGVLLHNFLYALGIIFEDIIILKYLMEILHVIFFFISIPISPIGFLIGLIGSIILFRKRRKEEKKNG